MTYGMHIQASATGVDDIERLAVATQSLAKALPKLSAGLDALKVPKLSGLTQAATVLSAFNASVATADLAKLNGLAAGMDRLAASAAKLSAVNFKVPKGLTELQALFSGGSSGGSWKGDLEIKGALNSLAAAQQAIATSLATLNVTVQQGYERAANSAEAGGKKLNDALAKGAAARAQQAAARKDIKFDSLSQDKQAEQVYSAGSHLAQKGMFSEEKVRSLFGNQATSIALQAQEKAKAMLGAAASEEAVQAAASAQLMQHWDNALQTAERTKRLTENARAQVEKDLVNLQRHIKEVDALKAKTKTTAQLADESYIVTGASGSVTGQIKKQMGARAMLDNGKGLEEVIAKHGQLAAAGAQAAGSMERLAALMTEAKANNKGAAADIDRLNAVMRERGAAADSVYTKLSRVQQIEQQIAARKALLNGDTESKVASTFGSKATDQAKLTQLEQLYGEKIKATNAALIERGRVLDQVRNAERASAAAIKDTQRINALNADDARNRIAAKQMLLGGAAMPEVQSKFGLEAAARASTTELSRLHQELNRFAPATGQVMKMHDAMNKLHSAARGVTSAFGGIWMTWGQMAPILAGAALGHSMASAIKIGAATEHNLTTIAELSDESASSVDRLRNSMMSLSNGAIGPEKVAEAAKTMSLAGLSAKEVAAGLHNVQNLAIAGTTDMNLAAETMVAVGTAYGYTATNYSVLADVISKTAAATMSDTSDMAAAFKYSTTVAEQYGVALSDTAVALGLLANRGIKGTSAGTAVRQMFTEMSGATIKTEKLFKQINFDAFDEKGTGGLKSMLQLIYELDNAVEKFNSKSRTKIIRDAFNERANKAVGGGLRSYQESLRQLTDTGAGQDYLQGKFGAGNTGTEYAKKAVKELIDLKNSGNFKGYVEALDEMATKARLTKDTMIGMFNEVDVKAAGFASLKSAAMQLSPQNAFGAVGNELKTSMWKVFEEIRPDLMNIASNLKAVFASPEFIQGVTNFTTLLGRMTLFVTENATAVGWMFKAFSAVAILYTARMGILAFTTGVVGSIGYVRQLGTGIRDLGTTFRSGATASVAGATAFSNMSTALGGVAVAQAGAGVAMKTAGSSVMALAGNFARALPIVGNFISLAIAAYSAWELFGKKQTTTNSVADAAASDLERYKQGLKDQIALNQQVVVSNGDVEESERHLASRRQESAIYAKLNESLNNPRYQELAAKQTNSARTKSNFLTFGELDELTGLRRGIDEAWTKTNKDLAEVKALEAKAKETAQTRKLAADAKSRADMQARIKEGEEFVGKSTKTGLSGASGGSQAGFRDDMSIYKTLQDAYKETTDSVEKSAKRRLEVLQASEKAGLVSSADAALQAEIIEAKKYDDLLKLGTDYIRDAEALFAKAEEDIKPNAKGGEKALQALQRAHASAVAGVTENMSDASHQMQLKGLARKTLGSYFTEIDDIYAKQSGESGRKAAESLTSMLETAMSPQQKLMIQAIQSASKAFEDKERELTSKRTALQLAQGKDMQAVAGMNANHADELITRIAEREKEIKLLDAAYAHLAKLRERAVDDAKSGGMPNKEVEAIYKQIITAASQRDELEKSIGDGVYDAFAKAIEGSDQHDFFRNLGDNVGKSIRTGITKALYSSLVDEPVKAMGKTISEALSGSLSAKDAVDKDGKPLPADKMQSVWSKAYKGINGFGAGVGDWWKGKDLTGVEDSPQASWNKMLDEFNTIPWSQYWNNVTDAFNKVDWAGVWEALKGFFTNASGPGAADNGLGAAFGSLLKVFTGTKTEGTLPTSNNSNYGGSGMTAEEASALFAAKGAAFSGASAYFAKGGAFANSIVSNPTMFKFGLGGANLGIMGEAGPEAIMPLQRDSRGRLGVSAGGGGSYMNMVTSNTFHNTYVLGGEVTRADLAQVAFQTQAATERSVADSLRRGERRFNK